MKASNQKSWEHAYFIFFSYPASFCPVEMIANSFSSMRASPTSIHRFSNNNYALRKWMKREEIVKSAENGCQSLGILVVWRRT